MVQFRSFSTLRRSGSLEIFRAGSFLVWLRLMWLRALEVMARESSYCKGGGLAAAAWDVVEGRYRGGMLP